MLDPEEVEGGSFMSLQVCRAQLLRRSVTYKYCILVLAHSPSLGLETKFISSSNAPFTTGSMYVLHADRWNQPPPVLPCRKWCNFWKMALSVQTQQLQSGGISESTILTCCKFPKTSELQFAFPGAGRTAAVMKPVAQTVLSYLPVIVHQTTLLGCS